MASRRSPMSEERIRIAYDGPALKSGEMDVYELAPALLAIGDLCQQANRVLNGDKAQVRVAVNSDFKTGSFDAWLSVYQDVTSTAQTVFGTGTVHSAADVVHLIGFSVAAAVGPDAGKVITNLLDFLKWLKGRKVEPARVENNGQHTQISVVGDNNTITVLTAVHELASEPKAVQAVERIVRPVEKNPGIDSFQTRDEAGQVIRTLPKDEVRELFADDMVVSDDLTYSTQDGQPVERILAVKKLWFDSKGTRKWSLTDGKASFAVVIEDHDFLARVASGEVNFNANTAMKVLLRTQSRFDAGQLKTEYIVTKVLQVPYGTGAALFPPPSKD